MCKTQEFDSDAAGRIGINETVVHWHAREKFTHTLGAKSAGREARISAAAATLPPVPLD